MSEYEEKEDETGEILSVSGPVVIAKNVKLIT
jgi:vacuolar-type H+-ATPase catalytic subunit A/Vma1